MRVYFVHSCKTHNHSAYAYATHNRNSLVTKWVTPMVKSWWQSTDLTKLAIDIFSVTFKFEICSIELWRSQKPQIEEVLNANWSQCGLAPLAPLLQSTALNFFLGLPKGMKGWENLLSEHTQFFEWIFHHHPHMFFKKGPWLQFQLQHKDFGFTMIAIVAASVTFAHNAKILFKIAITI